MVVVTVAQMTSVHSAGDVRIFHKECKSLAIAGHEVTLIAPNATDENLEGVSIVVITKNSSRSLRALSGSFQIFSMIYRSNVSVCHFHDPELIPVGVLLSLLGKKVIYDVHEDLPRQVLGKSWIPLWYRWPVSWLASAAEWVSSRVFFDRIVAATPTIAARFPSSKTVLVQNYPLLTELGGENSCPYLDRPKNVLYVGGISRIRGIIENVRAFEYLKDQDCRFKLAGHYMDTDLEQECHGLATWHKVDYCGFLSRDDVKKMLDFARVGLVLLHPLPNYKEAYPIKMFEYMSAGIPVIASDFPLWREIITGANCGVLVDPLSPKEIAGAIDWMMEHPAQAQEMGKNGRKAVLERYNWSIEEKKLLEMYKRLSQ